MSNKLDQSLDQIMTDARKTAPRRTRRRVTRPGKATVAPVGGVQKNTKPAKAAEKVAAVSAAPKSGDGKIVVSNLPMDVNESQIKDYFHTTIGPVKKVMLTYGPNGQSRGNATVTFVKHDSAVKAAKDLDGVKVDKRPMKIELIMGAKEVPAPAPPKSLGERISKPKPATKDKPKPTANAAQKTAGKPAVRGRVQRRGRNAGRGKPKTQEELDAEMVDYFGNEASAPANGDANMATNGGAVQPVANGEAAMEDEIM